MFLGKVMLDARREMGLKQVELAKGICTQNTITKIERYNTAPTTKTLVKLCKRLELTLNDVFSDFENDTSHEESQLLRETEDSILLGRFENSQEQIELISSSSLAPTNRIQLHTIKCLLCISKNEWADAQFLCNVILQETDNDAYNVYSVVAWICFAISYRKTGRIDQAQYFIDLVEKSIKLNSNIENATTLEMVFVYLKLAEHYDNAHDYSNFVKYIELGICENSRHNRTYLLEELYLLSKKMKGPDSASITFGLSTDNVVDFFQKFNSIEA